MHGWIMHLTPIASIRDAGCLKGGEVSPISPVLLMSFLRVRAGNIDKANPQDFHRICPADVDKCIL